MLEYFKKSFLNIFLLAPIFLAAEDIKIFTTLPVFSMIAQEIAGNHAKIDCLAQSQLDPHHLLITPSMSLAIENADLVLSSQEMVDQLPCEPHKIISLATKLPAMSDSLKERRHQVSHWVEALQSTTQDHHDHQHHNGCGCSHKNTLLKVQHEWLSLTSMQIFTEVFAKKISELDPEHAELYQQRSEGLIAKIEALKKQYQLMMPSKNILYYEEFGLLEQEMSADFGPVLYRCCHNKTLSPQRLAQLMMVQGEYQALLIPISLDQATQDQLKRVMNIPFIGIDTSGASFESSASYVDFMGTLLNVLYHS